jgi:DNA-binding GntR family transcriptional regulator
MVRGEYGRRERRADRAVASRSAGRGSAGELGRRGEPENPSLPARQVLADSVYEVVKQQIMDLKLAPSTRLNIDQLARELAVSNTPLREALVRLESEGLVTRRSLQGFSVAPLPDLRDMTQLFELRMMLEPKAVWAATKRLQPEDLRLLRSSVERMVKVADDSAGGHYRRHQALVAADTFFHDFIAEASGSQLLRRVVSGLHAHVTLYRVYFKVGATPEGGDSADEHAAILDALDAGNPQQAARAMRTHLERSLARHRRLYRQSDDGDWSPRDFPERAE